LSPKPIQPLIDHNKPIIPQITDLMRYLNYSEKNIKLAEKKMKGDVDYTINLTKNLVMMFIGQSIVRVVNETDLQDGKVK